MVAEVSENDAFRGGGVIWVRSFEKNPGVQLVYIIKDNIDEGDSGEKKIDQKSKGKSRGRAPPLSLKNLSPLAWIFFS